MMAKHTVIEHVRVEESLSQRKRLPCRLVIAVQTKERWLQECMPETEHGRGKFVLDHCRARLIVAIIVTVAFQYQIIAIGIITAEQTGQKFAIRHLLNECADNLSGVLI